jgi:hypothetical protein
MFNKKKNKQCKPTYLTSLLAKRYWYVRVSREVNPSISLILYD